jgi:hypothetical protein
MAFIPKKDREKEEMRRMLAAGQYAATPQQVKNEKKSLLNVALTYDHEMLASDVLPQVLSTLPITLGVKIYYKGSGWFFNPSFRISAILDGSYKNKKELYTRAFDSDYEDEAKFYVPNHFGAKRVTDILIGCYHLSGGKLSLEIYSV